MIEKSRSRGRPRSYDPDTVLDRAAQLFWANGFSATSLDDLSAAMGMGRPSIYNAFGIAFGSQRDAAALPYHATCRG